MYEEALSRYTSAKHNAAQADIDFASETISKSDRDKVKDEETAGQSLF